jgi:hypothetical protein
VIVNTLLEHNSNELPWRSLKGYELVRLDVDAEGFLDLSELEALFRLTTQSTNTAASGCGCWQSVVDRTCWVLSMTWLRFAAQPTGMMSKSWWMPLS